MPNPTINDVRPVNEFLTGLSVAYLQSRPAVSDRLFPRVSVDVKNGSYYVWDKAETWRDSARERAPGDDFARFTMALSSDTFNAREYAMEYQLPDEIRANQGAALNLDMTATQSVYNKLALQKDLTFATNFMTTTAGWTSGSLGSGKWSAASSTPRKDIRAALRSIVQALGDSPDHRMVAVCGRIVEDALLANTDITNLLTYVQVGTVSNIRAALAGVLGLDEIIVADRMYTTSKEKQTTATSPVFDDDMLIVAVPRSGQAEVAAAGYTFAWDEGGRGDLYVESYRDENKKSDIVRGVTHYDMKQVGAALGVFFSDCAD